MLERLVGDEYYCFLDGYLGYNQISIAPEDQDKTTFTCPFGTFACRRMPFDLCNAPVTFQCCMLSLFSDMVERFLKIFMNDFSIYGDSFDQCLHHLKLVLQRCIEKNLTLNWEKCQFMAKHGSSWGTVQSGTSTWKCIFYEINENVYVLMFPQYFRYSTGSTGRIHSDGRR